MPRVSDNQEPLKQEKVVKVVPKSPPGFKKEETPVQTNRTSGEETMTPGKELEVGLMPNVGFLLEETNIYEYALGIRDISVKANLFKNSGVFVSKPMNINGNVLEVELEAVEEHPIFDEVSGLTTSRKTSVEYYISGEEHPGQEDWVPLLPLDERQVRCERLFFVNGMAKLRFQAEIASVVVYRDGLRLSTEDYVVTEQGRGVFLENREEGSIYTIDYSPTKDSSAWTLDLNRVAGTVKRQVDRFQGASHNKTVQLSRYPYIDWAKINAGENYEPFEVRLRDANIIGPKGIVYKEVGPESEGEEPFTRDKTSYVDGEWKALEPYGPGEEDYKGFDYYNHRDKLVFSETFSHADILNEMDDTRLSHGRADIEVGYDYLSTNFRLKIILRRNSEEEDMVSPSVKHYQLRFKTMK